MKTAAIPHHVHQDAEIAITTVFSAAGMHRRSTGAAVVLTAFLMAATACSGGDDGPLPTSRHPTASAHGSAASADASPAPALPATTLAAVDAQGAMPQTPDRPAVDDELLGRVEAYFDAVRTGDASGAEALFFPLPAYQQVKTLRNPAADWRDRLLHLFDLDLSADHELLGGQPSAARFVGLDVPQRAVRWIPPGSEHNRIGYWRVYGARLRYTDGPGTPERSYGIASMISWRGRWYVVHLGPNSRPSPVGTVCTPRPPQPGIPSATVSCG